MIVLINNASMIRTRFLLSYIFSFLFFFRVKYGLSAVSRRNGFDRSSMPEIRRSSLTILPFALFEAEFSLFVEG